MACRLGQLSADVAAARALLPISGARLGTGSARTTWLLLGVGAAAVAATCVVLHRRGHLRLLPSSAAAPSG